MAHSPRLNPFLRSPIKNEPDTRAASRCVRDAAGLGIRPVARVGGSPLASVFPPLFNTRLTVAKKPNYSFEKRAREAAKNKKKEEKLQRKREKSASGAEGDQEEPSQEPAPAE